MAKKQEQAKKSAKDKSPSSTTSLGKRRSLGKRQQQRRQRQQQQQSSKRAAGQSGSQLDAKESAESSTMSHPRSSEYGSQATSIRRPTTPKELIKVAILGGAGGIGQPLGLLLMLHSEYVHHLALHDLVDSVRGVGLDLSHIDRQCKVTTHQGPDELADAVRGARVIIIPAGLAQKPGMSRDDLFGSNAKIVYNLARVCAQTAPEAMLAIITNPVNSLVPLVCEVYKQHFSSSRDQQQTAKTGAQSPTVAASEPTTTVKETDQQQQTAAATGPGQSTAAATTATKTTTTDPKASTTKTPPASQQQGKSPSPPADESYRRIFGVTTLDVVRASSLTSRSAFYRTEPNGLFKDPSKLQVPVVGGHAGKTIVPLLSQATPKLDKKRLTEDKATVSTLVETIREAGIEVLNEKKGKGSATLAMAYAACRFTISLLRAQLGESNIVECAYVRHATPVYSDLDYFAAPLHLGRNGYTRSLGLGKVMAFEEQMLEEAARELRLSIAKGEDFAREQLSADMTRTINTATSAATTTDGNTAAAADTTNTANPAANS